MNKRNRQPIYIRRKRPDATLHQPPPPGQMALVMAGLAIGILLMSIQLWLLTITLELYLAGEGQQIWLIALVSGAIFVGGLLMLRLLRRRPRVPRGSIEEPPQSARR
jgi:hypothetical protein